MSIGRHLSRKKAKKTGTCMKRRDRQKNSPASRAFTLVEALVSMAIIAMLLIILMSMTNQVTTVWRYTSGKIDQFQKGREAFESMTRGLSAATLNTYLDYNDPTAPTAYIRQSELRFLSGPTNLVAGTPPAGKSWFTHSVFFQAPLGVAEPGSAQLAGLYSLLNTRGYFVEFGDDLSSRPNILTPAMIPARHRFRLYEMIQPSSGLTIYNYTSGLDANNKPKNESYVGKEWFTDALTRTGTDRPVHILAENVIALVLLPRLASAEDPTGTGLSPKYVYDSTIKGADPKFNPNGADPKFNYSNQLPPIIQVTMVVIDENSAKRLEQGAAIPPALNMDDLFKDADQYQDNLNTLEKRLIDNHVQYRVFTTNVQIKGAKWSKDQVN